MTFGIVINVIAVWTWIGLISIAIVKPHKRYGFSRKMLDEGTEGYFTYMGKLMLFGPFNPYLWKRQVKADGGRVELELIKSYEDLLVSVVENADVLDEKYVIEETLFLEGKIEEIKKEAGLL